MRNLMLIAAGAAMVPVGGAQAAALCPTLKSALSLAKTDKFLAAWKVGQARAGEWTASHQIDGFKCVVTTGSTNIVRGFYSCTFQGDKANQPVAQSVDAIGKCFGVTPRVDEKSYTTSYGFDLQAAPRIWVALNDFKSGKFSLSLIAE